MNYCSPNINTSDHFTCFSQEELVSIADAFNKYIKKYDKHNNHSKHNKNNLNLINLNENNTKQNLWNEIYNRLKNVCKYEYCWIDLKFVDSISDKNLRKKIKFFTFKPKMTMYQYSWLSTNDINYVLKQYEKLDKNFKFVGALPSDFYKIIPKKMLKDIYKDILNYSRIGFVFNLDKHNQSGSHWVALYIDHNSKTIEYFDSLGNTPNKYILKFIESINVKISEKYNYNFKILINNITHQLENSECGIYSIYYIIHRLFGDSFDELSTFIIRDEKMNKFRNQIFRPRN